ncbi:Tn10-like transposase [Deinococcus gobiensis I-0]|uniref:Tn10-like transposase n=2 Tax=Deinococcus TaxID=1298 RepID=H8GYQ0_DEIGI|nr:Tn10-like transposase [Deinococcus gobiensis I-0]
MVLAFLGGKDIRHAELAARFRGSAHNASVIRRVERFFDRHPIQPADVARVVLTLLPSAQPREFILDRTNWKYGQTDVNVLLLAVIWRGGAIPLLFLYELLPHGGGSHTEIRHTLMDDALCLLCAAEIRVLYADREFVGYNWIQGMAHRGIPICVHLWSDTLMDAWTAKDWLSRLQTGTAGLQVEYTLVYGQLMNVVLTHTRDGEALVIASNARAVTTIQTRYRRRFLIECLFRALKTKGFQLEATHMTLHDHVERLLCLLTLTYTWCVLVRVTLDRPKKAHGRRAWSVVKMGLRELVRAFSRESTRLCDLIDLLLPSQTNHPESVGY